MLGLILMVFAFVCLLLAAFNVGSSAGGSGVARVGLLGCGRSDRGRKALFSLTSVRPD